jgi:hypothetical protein
MPAADTIRPRWTLLYGAALSGVVTLALAEMAAPPSLRTGVRCAIALGAFVTLAVWLRCNRAALDLQEWCDCAPRTITVRVIESPRRPARAVPDRVHPTPVGIEEAHELAHR